MIQLMARCLTPQSDGERFEWLYCASPFGPARSWVACEEPSGAIIGIASAFPRRMHFAGTERMGFVLADFCMDEKYRSLGPSLQLQRALFAAVDGKEFEFFYDFPSRSMMAVYSRLGTQEAKSIWRWAKPLSTKKRLELTLRSKTLAAGIAASADRLLASQGWKGKKHSCKLELHSGHCGEEFTALDHQTGKLPGIKTSRTAEYLNWRYLSYAKSPHEILTARRGGALLGYAILTRDCENACIADLCSVDEAGVIARLLAGSVERLRARGAVTASLNACDTHPWNGIFERAGFRRRESAPVVLFVHPNASAAAAGFRDSWYMMRGERDS
jgi:hypothetical protein